MRKWIGGTFLSRTAFSPRLVVDLGYRGKPRLSVKLRPLVGELHFRRFAMPTYDFRCDKCKKKFTLIMAISEYEKTKIRCPKCKSTRVKQQITPFQVVTSKKS
jgi:putative FmdB family regulatory protein